MHAPKLVTALLVLSALVLAQPTEATLVFRKAGPSVVVVSGKTPDGLSQGSGVIIGARHVVTNLHVVRLTDPKTIRVRSGDKIWPASIRSAGAGDLALLEVAEPLGLPAATIRSLAGAPPEPGERVYALGAPRGLEHTISEGIISGAPTRTEGPVLIQTSAAISPGSSGGGLFDSSGRLLAITTLYLKDSQSLNFAIAADEVAYLDGSPVEPAWKTETRLLREAAEAKRALEARLLVRTDEGTWASERWLRLRWGMGSADAIDALKPLPPGFILDDKSNEERSTYFMGRIKERLYGHDPQIDLSFTNLRLTAIHLSFVRPHATTASTDAAWTMGVFERLRAEIPSLAKAEGEPQCHDDPHLVCTWSTRESHITLRRYQGARWNVVLTLVERD